jgi:GNAT superfamily N-acetyltransferase
LTFDLKKSGDPELSQMRHPHGTFVVARLGDMPLGCVGVKGNGGPLAEVKRMWIAPAARRLGLGRRLMTRAEDAVRGLPITTLRLDTNSTLFEAVSLYRRRGGPRSTGSTTIHTPTSSWKSSFSGRWNTGR